MASNLPGIREWVWWHQLLQNPLQRLPDPRGPSPLFSPILRAPLGPLSKACFEGPLEGPLLGV